MAEIRVELDKMRERDPGTRVTIKGKNRSQTCNAAEAVTVLAGDVSKGRGEEKVHIIDHEAERVRKLTNPKQSTKRIFNCRTPEQWTELNTVIEPFYEEATDPHVAIDLIIEVLGGVSREDIRAMIHEGEQERPGPEKAEPIPDEAWFNPTMQAREPGDEPEDELPEFLR